MVDEIRIPMSTSELALKWLFRALLVFKSNHRFIPMLRPRRCWRPQGAKGTGRPHLTQMTKPPAFILVELPAYPESRSTSHAKFVLDDTVLEL